MRDDAVSPVIGVILMVAVTVSLGFGVIFLAQDAQEDLTKPSYVGFNQSESEVMVVDVYGEAIMWEDVSVTGCDKPEGQLSGGDLLTNCAGLVNVVWDNKLLFTGEF